MREAHSEIYQKYKMELLWNVWYGIKNIPWSQKMLCDRNMPGIHKVLNMREYSLEYCWSKKERPTKAIIAWNFFPKTLQYVWQGSKYRPTFEYFRVLNMPRIRNMSLVTLIFEIEPFFVNLVTILYFRYL